LPLVLKTLQTLRAAGVSVQMHASSGEGMGSMKSQFKRADSSGARFALIFGTDEVSKNQVTIKSLRDGSGGQASHSLANIAGWVSTLQSLT
ncbi:MAG: hypothetical protein RL710_2471, partial [Pseudomonadota bacterium]